MGQSGGACNDQLGTFVCSGKIGRDDSGSFAGDLPHCLFDLLGGTLLDAPKNHSDIADKNLVLVGLNLKPFNPRNHGLTVPLRFDD